MIQIDHMTFSCEERAERTGGARDIKLQVKRGGFAVLCGKSDCGKTTITYLTNGLTPHYYGEKMSGNMWVDGVEVSKQPFYGTAKIVGGVLQSPRSQFSDVDTTSETTFGCENLDQLAETTRARLEKTVCDFRLEKLTDRDIFHLSGGEKQKVACTGVPITEPEIPVLNEPSSNLDAASISDLRKTLAFWGSQGETIIVSECRLYCLCGLANRFIYMKDGKTTREYTAEEFSDLSEQAWTEIGLRTSVLEQLQPPQTPQCTGTELELKQFRFAHPYGSSILHMQNCTIPAGRIVDTIGDNGAGKSTPSRCSRELERQCGEVIWNGRRYRSKDRLNTCYMVMQEVSHQLFIETVLDEVLISMEEPNTEQAEEILTRLDLLLFRDKYPISLSDGQKQRMTIASVIASKRFILFFDEPTSGLNYRHMKEVATVLRQLSTEGVTVYAIIHDLGLLLNCCTDIIHFAQGNTAGQYSVDADGLSRICVYFMGSGA